MGSFSVAIVGLGRIAQDLDRELNLQTHCLTHGSAFFSHPDFHIVAGIDPNSTRRQDFSKRFQAEAYSSAVEVKSKNPDVWVICGPTAMNFQIFKQVVSFKPKFILMEKPMGQNLAQAQEILGLAHQNKVRLGVNFIRRAEPGIIELRRMIKAGELGQIEKVILTYSKGLLNNGSHFIDLMRFFFGESSFHSVISSIDQSYQGDPEPDFLIQFGKTPVFFLSAKESNFSMRDIEMIGSKGVAKILRGGERISVHPIIESQLFKGYRFTSFDGKEIQNDFHRVQFHVADEIAKSLLANEPVSFSGESSLITMEDVERIRKLCLVQ